MRFEISTEIYMSFLDRNDFAPVINGFINDSLGFHYVFYIPATILGGVWIFLLFFMEETNYDHSTVGVVVADLAQPSRHGCLQA